jgi:hypothetical protein
VLQIAVAVAWIVEVSVDVAVTVDVGVTVMVLVEVLVDVGAATVVVLLVTPMQEQADEYRTVPEQAEAYVGTLDGMPVCCRITRVLSAERGRA